MRAEMPQDLNNICILTSRVVSIDCSEHMYAQRANLESTLFFWFSYPWACKQISYEIRIFVKCISRNISWSHYFQEIIKVKEWIPHIGLLTKVTPTKVIVKTWYPVLTRIITRTMQCNHWQKLLSTIVWIVYSGLLEFQSAQFSGSPVDSQSPLQRTPSGSLLGLPFRTFSSYGDSESPQ